MDAGAGRPALAPGDDVEPRIAVAVAGRSLAAQIGDIEAPAAEALAHQLGAGRIGLARRVDRGDADELAGELDHGVALRVDFFHQGVEHPAPSAVVSLDSKSP